MTGLTRRTPTSEAGSPATLTLLDLVAAVTDEVADERELAAAVMHLLSTRVRRARVVSAERGAGR